MVDFMNAAAAKADLFLPGIAEARLLMGEPEATAEQAAAHYLGLGTDCVVVKQGSRGDNEGLPTREALAAYMVS